MPRRFQLPTDEQRCVATVVHGPRKGERCPKFHIKGATVCQQHGAKAPQVAAAARRRIEEQETRELAAKIDVELPEFTSAQDAARYMLDQVSRRAAAFGVLADQLGDSLTYRDRGGTERVRAAVNGQRQWLDSMAKLLAVAVTAEQSASRDKNVSDAELTDIVDAAHAAFSKAVHSAFDKAALVSNTSHPAEPPWHTREILPGSEPGYVLLTDRYGESAFRLRICDTAMVEEVRAAMLESFHAYWELEYRWRLAERPDVKAKRQAYQREKAARGEG